MRIYRQSVASFHCGSSSARCQFHESHESTLGTYKEDSDNAVSSSDETPAIRRLYSPFEDKHTSRLGMITATMSRNAVMGLVNLLQDPMFDIDKVDLSAIRAVVDY